MRTQRYRVNEVFLSLQGEGFRQGEPSIFVRFTGCNLRCDVVAGRLSPGGFDCDTEFESGRWLSLEELLSEVALHDCEWVVLTGGEPMLQVDDELIEALHGAGKKIQIETNGSQPVPDSIDFITVSPKVAEHALKQRTAHEVKYVRHRGQALPRTKVVAEHYYLSPAFIGNQPDDAALQTCRELAAQNPPWKVSIQMHKLWGVR